MAPTDLEVGPGEIVGLAGLLGSGRTELVRLLFAADRADSGFVEIEGVPVRLRSPRDAIARGMGFCPEDRRAQALLPHLSVRENIVLALQARQGIVKTMSVAAQRDLAEGYVRLLRIATIDAEKAVGLLSGGNQQKVVLARWLAAQPRLLILDEPTRGIDLGAREEIERFVRELTGQGVAIIHVSAELDELVRVSDRVAVMRDRSKVAELASGQFDVDSIMRLIAADAAA